jgi:hypothetical protein
MPDDTSHRSLMSFFAHPSVGIVGSIASIISLIFAFFSVESRTKPGLTTYVHPARATVVKSGQASALTVLFRGQPIGSDISAAQIAIWNEGKQPIPIADVRQPISVVSSVPILEATVRKKSRDVVNITLDRAHLEEGRVGIGWDLLEQDDGAIIQLIYAGGPDVQLRTVGTVIGQRTINQIIYSQKLRTPNEQYETLSSIDRLFSYFFLATAVLLCIFVYAIPPRSRLVPLRPASIARFLAVVSYVAFAVWLFLTSAPSGPPFGF